VGSVRFGVKMWGNFHSSVASTGGKTLHPNVTRRKNTSFTIGDRFLNYLIPNSSTLIPEANSSTLAPRIESPGVIIDSDTIAGVEEEQKQESDKSLNRNCEHSVHGNQIDFKKRKNSVALNSINSQSKRLCNVKEESDENKCMISNSNQVLKTTTEEIIVISDDDEPVPVQEPVEVKVSNNAVKHEVEVKKAEDSEYDMRARNAEFEDGEQVQMEKSVFCNRIVESESAASTEFVRNEENILPNPMKFVHVMWKKNLIQAGSWIGTKQAVGELRLMIETVENSPNEFMFWIRKNRQKGYALPYDDAIRLSENTEEWLSYCCYHRSDCPSNFDLHSVLGIGHKDLSEWKSLREMMLELDPIDFQETFRYPEVRDESEFSCEYNPLIHQCESGNALNESDEVLEPVLNEKSDVKKKRIPVDVSHLRLNEIKYALEFYPTEEEFKDPYAYIRSISSEGKKTGICKIIPPESWNPPDRVNSEWNIRTKMQPIHELINRDASKPLAFTPGTDCSVGEYKGFADKYKEWWLREHHTCEIEKSSGVAQRLGDRMALIEQKFWSSVVDSKDPLYTMYANDMDVSEFEAGGAFEPLPKTRDEDVIKKFMDENPWNLNVLPNLEDGLLTYISMKKGEKMSGICEPWIYFGMLFSTFCWHVEDNYLYSINYMHKGDSKVWYGIASEDARKFEKIFRQEHEEKFVQGENLVHDITTLVSPCVLMKAGVPVYRLEQKAREFVITFPQAYHAGFSTGFNCAEAVNFAMSDWFEYSERCERSFAWLRKSTVLLASELVYRMFEDSNGLFNGRITEKERDKMVEILENEKKNQKVFRRKIEQLKLPKVEEPTEDEKREVPTCLVCKQLCPFAVVMFMTHGRKLFVCLKDTVYYERTGGLDYLAQYIRFVPMKKITVALDRVKSFEARLGPGIESDSRTKIGVEYENSLDKSDSEDQLIQTSLGKAGGKAECLACASRVKRCPPWRDEQVLETELYSFVRSRYLD